MMAIASKSSIIAMAVKNILIESGARLPVKDKTPSEKAMSVAVGIAQPRSATPSPQFAAV